MTTIKCPQCGTEIELGQDAYNSLLREIEETEVAKRVNERVGDIEEALKAKFETATLKAKSSQDAVIGDLKAKNQLLEQQLKSVGKETELAVSKAVVDLKEAITKRDAEIANLKDKYANDIKAKDEDIQYWKSYRMGDSTKDLGESLEHYCEETFNAARQAAYPNAYFEKDNTSDEEGKGDFIFRDFRDGIETLSIMFEMKTDKDTTVKRSKNEEFLKKLDANRNSKKCEYAVLVTTLEPESKLYTGITDVSYKYPKMFVVRPQHFMAIIGLLRSMANETYAYKRQVIEYQRQNVDITNFENVVMGIGKKISDDYAAAVANGEQIVKFCDDAIKALNEIKDKVRIQKDWLVKAQNQLPNLEVRKLTRKNPTMKAMFEALEAEKGDE